MNNIISPEKIELLEAEVKQLRGRYNPRSVKDLVEIARKEYGVRHVVRTPLVHHDVFGWVDGDPPIILYYSEFRFLEVYALAHEIGHVALGHLDRNKARLPLEQGEAEADYFAYSLTRVSPLKVNLYATIDIILDLMFLMTDESKEREKKLLLELGVPPVEVEKLALFA